MLITGVIAFVFSILVLLAYLIMRGGLEGPPMPSSLEGATPLTVKLCAVLFAGGVLLILAGAADLKQSRKG